MDTGSMDKLANADRQDIVTRAALGPEARRAVAEVETVSGLIATLAGAGFLVEAARCFAHALPRREAVWWSCMCAASTAPDDLPALDRSARDAAETWVRTQTEESRRQAMALAEALGFETPEAWAAVGAFWAGPSVAADGAPPSPPAPHMTGVAVAGAIVLASVRGDPAMRLMRLERFLSSAREIAQGGTGRLTGVMA
jgi:hypothetical protein